MNLDQHEEYIKKSLATFEVEVDTDALWSAVEDHVPEQPESRRKLALWWWLGAFAVGMLMTYFVMSSDDVAPTSNSDQTNLLAEKIRSKNSSYVAEEEQGLGGNHSVRSSTNTEKEISQSTSKTGSQTSFTEISNESKKTSSEVLSTTKVIATAVLNDELAVEETKTSVDKVTVAEEGKAINTTINSPVKDMLLVNETKEKLDHRSIIVCEESPSLDMGMLVANDRTFEDVRITPYSKRKRWIKAATIYAGAGNVHLAHTKTSSEQQAFIDYLATVESTLPSLTLGATVMMPLSEKMSLESGLSYSRYVYRLSSKFTAVSNGTEPGTTDVTIDSQGNRASATGEVATQHTLDYMARSHTYLHQLDLPLVLDLTLYDDRVWTLSARAGGIVGLWHSAAGYRLSEDLTHEAFRAGNSPYESRLSISPVVGVRVGRTLSGNTRLFAQLQTLQRSYNKSTNVGVIRNNNRSTSVDLGLLIDL